MDFGGEMHRAAPPDRVPIGGVGRAVYLCPEAKANGRFLRREAAKRGSRLPGGPARRSPKDPHLGDQISFSLCMEFGEAEVFTINSEVDRPPQGASDRGCPCPFDLEFLSRGHHRNPPLHAPEDQVSGKVGVWQVIEDEIGVPLIRKNSIGLVQDGGERLVYGLHIE